MDFQSWGAHHPRPPRPSHLHGGSSRPPHTLLLFTSAFGPPDRNSIESRQSCLRIKNDYHWAAISSANAAPSGLEEPLRALLRLRAGASGNFEVAPNWTSFRLCVRAVLCGRAHRVASFRFGSFRVVRSFRFVPFRFVRCAVRLAKTSYHFPWMAGVPASSFWERRFRGRDKSRSDEECVGLWWSWERRFRALLRLRAGASGHFERPAAAGCSVVNSGVFEARLVRMTERPRRPKRRTQI